MKSLTKAAALTVAALLVAASLAVVPFSAETPAQAATMAGLQRRVHIKTTIVTVRGKGDTAAAVNGIPLSGVRAAINSSDRYWRQLSNNRFSISVVRTVTGFRSKYNVSGPWQKLIPLIAREFGWVDRPNEALILVIPRQWVRASDRGYYSGAAYSTADAGGRMLLPVPGGYTTPVVIHEYGHLFGLMHANRLQCTNGIQDTAPHLGRWRSPGCSSEEYGDEGDMMGRSRPGVIPHVNSALHDAGSLGTGREIYDAGAIRGTRFLRLKSWAGPGFGKAVRIKDPISGETYYLELRVPVGRDVATAQGGNSGVRILKSDSQWGGFQTVLLTPSTRPGSSQVNQAWKPGQRFTTHAGMRITIRGIRGSRAVIMVEDKATAFRLKRPLPAVSVGITKTAHTALVRWQRPRAMYRRPVESQTVVIDGRRYPAGVAATSLRIPNYTDKARRITVRLSNAAGASDSMLYVKAGTAAQRAGFVTRPRPADRLRVVRDGRDALFFWRRPPATPTQPVARQTFIIDGRRLFVPTGSSSIRIRNYAERDSRTVTVVLSNDDGAASRNFVVLRGGLVMTNPAHALDIRTHAGSIALENAAGSTTVPFAFTLPA